MASEFDILQPFFNEQYYLNTYPDAPGSFASGWEHFKTVGLPEHRSPSSGYDRAYYLTQSIDNFGASGQRDLIMALDGDDIIRGYGGTDEIYAGNGNDIINGGPGADTMNGEGGDDLYIVDDANDVINETANNGIDVVRSPLSYNLTSNVENLILTENGDIDGRGNNSDNRIFGNVGNNLLIGGNGTDTLVGNAGNDTANGGDGNDMLDGGDGNDVLNGWTGIDTMKGGAGDDFYLVDNSNDFIYEGVNAGNDIVSSNVSYNLANNIENLTLTENGDIDGRGNNSDNRITGNGGNNLLIGANGSDTLVGNAGNDTFNGGAGDDLLNGGDGNDILNGWIGADTMSGGAGNDIYIIDNARDVIREGFFDGSDLIISTASYSLDGINVENLTLTGNANINAIGNEKTNRITGNDGNNILDLVENEGVLIGNGGNDIFVVGINRGNPTIRDFTDGEDLIQLTGGLTFEDLHIYDWGGLYTSIRDANTWKNVAMLKGVDSSTIDSNDFVVEM